MNLKAYRLAIWAAAIIAFHGATASAQSPDYDQPYRPQLHFSPREHWTNDPNGLVYFRGEYHLFFQYNPFGDKWGHMSWGHAVSSDLLRWRELPVAIPEKDGVMIFTGSIVVDRNNSSGFCTPAQECLVAIYTGDSNTSQGHRETQNLAYSIDDGHTWKHYEKNPVLDLHMTDFRDPSVSWNETTHSWIMAVALPNEHRVRFYSSPNLKHWSQLSDFGPAGDTDGQWECPDLLRIPSTSGHESIWALKIGINPGAPQGGSGEQYFLGSFDGKTFTASTAPGTYGWTNYGKDDYCAISFNGLPKDQKPVLIGWMNNWQYAEILPTSPWRGQMSLPRRLSFVKDLAGLALKQEPVIEGLRTKGFPIPESMLGKQGTVAIPYELDLQFKNQSAANFGIRIYSDEEHWTEIGFDTAKKEFYMDRTKSGIEVSKTFPARTVAPLVSGRPYNLKLIVDRSSVEAFAQNETIAMTDLIYPQSHHSTVQVFPRDARSADISGHLWELQSIWKPSSNK